MDIYYPHTFKDRIIDFVADVECKKICEATVNALRMLERGYILEEEDPYPSLDNVWNVICYIVQEDYDINYSHIDGYYKTFVNVLINSKVNELPDYIKMAIWWQPYYSNYWNNWDGHEPKLLYDKNITVDASPYDIEGCCFDIADINKYIWNEYVLKEAAHYSDERLSEAIYG